MLIMRRVGGRTDKHLNLCTFNNMFNIVQNRTVFQLEGLYYLVVKSKELTPKQVLSVPCTTCGAAIGEACELHTGAMRSEPHRDRKLSAAEAVNNGSPQTMSEV